MSTRFSNGTLWVSVLEASLEDRQDFMRRLKSRPMTHASAVEIDRHELALASAKRQIDEIVADLARARGEA